MGEIMIIGAEGATTVASLLASSTADLTTAMGSVWTLITGNPLTSFSVGATILSCGFLFFKKALHTARK